MKKIDFKNLNFTDNELFVYSYLIDNGSQTVVDLQKNLKITRQGLYDILNRLIEKKLVLKEDKIFKPLNPIILYNKLIKEEKKIEKQKLSVINLFENYNKSKIKLYYGEDTIKEMIRELKKKKVTKGVIVLNYDYMEKKINSRRSKESFKDDIVIYLSKKDNIGRLANNQILLKAKHLNAFIDLTVLGDKVIIYSSPKNKESYGLIIEDENYANLLKDLIANISKK